MAEREWTIKAPKGRGLTAAELRDALEMAPAGVEPTVMTLGFTGKIKSITVKASIKDEK